MLKLKSVLQKVGRKQAELAEHLNVSQATVAQVVNHGEWPKSLDETDLQESIRRYLQAHGASDGDIEGAFEEVSEPRGNAARSISQTKTDQESNQEETMLLIRHSNTVQKAHAA
ncbi:hypothetical protein [Chromobacterium violaceum]|uniref:HTH cro/C1-type domain-containing protein n=1 Tax=Chromobacterium violaceum TaxID=536 RepID=A0AAX2M8Q6_CHRVL|nr:hypothetical protein [Chromobacterium violaceum]STB70523.1 Uncharacterised protein [Chromobacterium violaceum]SUX32650.1 Uncharacterised protein [Chromobacterium violaceum]